MFISKRIYEPSATIQRAIADIQISMAGIIGQKLLCKDYSIGSQNDLDHARNIAYNLFNCNGYSSCWETLPGLTERSRTETSIKRRRMERKIEKFLKMQERKTYMYLRKHLKQINVLADLLFEKKILNSNEIMECLSDKKINHI